MAKNNPPIGNKIKSQLLMEVSWQMWKTEKNHIPKKKLHNVLSQLCKAKGLDVSRQQLEDVIQNSRSYSIDSDNQVFFKAPYFLAYYLAKRLFLTLRKARMKSIYKLLNTRNYNNDILYFLSMLDQDTNAINQPLQEILKNEYTENVTENALHILYITEQIKQDFQTKQPKEPMRITQYNLTQNLDFSLEVKNNTFNNNNDDAHRAKNYFNQGLRLLKENKNFESLEPFFAAKALDPDCIKALNNLAVAFKNMGSHTIARQIVNRVLLEDPNNDRAKAHLKYLDHMENQTKALSGENISNRPSIPQLKTSNDHEKE